MRRSSALLLLASLASATTATAQVTTSSTVDPRRSTLAVTAQARQGVAPDRAMLALGLEVIVTDPADAATRLATLERGVVDTLRRLGIPASAIVVNPYGVAVARLSGSFQGQSTIPQHAARSVVRVEVERISEIGAIAAAAVAKGPVHVNTPIFSYGQADSLRRVLLLRALEQARLDAEVLARGLRVTLGRLVDVSQPNFSAGVGFTGSETIVFPSNSQQFSGFNQQGAPAVTAAVTVRWEITGGPTNP